MRPEFDGAVVGRRDEVQSVVLLELNGRHELGVRGDGVDATTLTKIPYFTGVVFAGRGQVVTVGSTVHAEDAL